MAHLTQEHVQHLYDTFGELRVLDDVIRYRAADSPPVSILGYPRGESADDYETFTGEQLDKFIDAAAKYFVSCGIKEASSNQRTYAQLSKQTDVHPNRTRRSQLGYSLHQMSTSSFRSLHSAG